MQPYNQPEEQFNASADSLEQFDLGKRKLLSALSHGAIFFSSLFVSIAVPIVILLVSQDPVVKANASESLNFHINTYIYAAIFSLLIFVLIGFPLLVLLGIATFVLPLIAVVKVLTNPNHPYRYPFLIRLL
ncbi:MAG: DUF4870 domain-containing protein [Elainella sp.]